MIGTEAEQSDYNADPRAIKANKALAYLQSYVAELGEKARNPENDAVASIRIMDECNTMKARVGEMVKSPLEAIYDMLRFAIIPARMEAEGITSITVEGIGRCNAVPDVQVKQLDKTALYDWLVENELEDMIVQSVNAQTLAAFVRNRIKDGKTLPAIEVLDVKAIQRAQITRK